MSMSKGETVCRNCGVKVEDGGRFPFCRKLACLQLAARIMGVEIAINPRDLIQSEEAAHD